MQASLAWPCFAWQLFPSEEEGTEFLFSCLSVESCQQFAPSEALHYLCRCKPLHYPSRQSQLGRCRRSTWASGECSGKVQTPGSVTRAARGGSAVQPFSTLHNPPTSTLPASGMGSAALRFLSISPASEMKVKQSRLSPLPMVLCSLFSTR